jgi:inner membrane protein
MHVQTHVMSGWCVGNLFRLTGRERLWCMVAASAADVDGLSIIGGRRMYQDWHHVVGHNLFFAVLLAGALAAFSTHRFKAFWVYLGLAHLHLVLDWFGSGPLWGIYYLWPASREHLRYFEGAWEFSSWQNYLTAGMFLGWTVLIGVYLRRTPLEVIMPELDWKLVGKRDANVQRSTLK